MTTQEAELSAADVAAPLVAEAVRQAREWTAAERAAGTLLGEETLWSEAYRVYARAVEDLPEGHRAGAWASIASELVFDAGRVPLNQRTASNQACELLGAHPDLPLGEQARRLQGIAEKHNVEPGKMRALLRPGIGYPWMFPRALWSSESVVGGLEAMLASFGWEKGEVPGSTWLREHALRDSSPALLAALEARAPAQSTLRRALAAVRSFVEATADAGRDVCAVETHAFIAALAGHGLSEDETAEWQSVLLVLREAVVLLESFRLYQRAERLVATAEGVADDEPRGALNLLTKAAGIYQRIAVGQMYPERLVERQQQIARAMEQLRAVAGIDDDRSDHVLLVSTYQSPADLQRLLLSVAHEQMGFAYGRDVHVVVSDDSTGEARRRNEQIYEEATRSGLSVSEWSVERRAAFLDRLNAEVFPDGTFDVRHLAGPRKPGEKGVPYGRLRNFLRLAALEELADRGDDRPVFTWLDQDNELGALVLTRGGTLAKRHVFNYFDRKSDIFSDPKILVGGGGYTNDALEGVEKFWVAWGIMHTALGLAQEHAPQGPAVLSPEADITRFRPWDQSDTLERLPREGEEVETMSDQFLLLLNTLVGTFRGKYDNQVQIYHPWTSGDVDPDDEHLVEQMRPFAGMPGGNTSFTTDVLASPIPFITVGGRGEDIFHLWQLEGTHGPGTIFLTHTPALHTRNVKGGRGDLMTEIIDSFNGRIFREPPYLWSALSNLSAGLTGADAFPGQVVEEQTAERIQGLKDEAKASMSAVSGFAAALEPYLDQAGEFWWLSQARDDPRCAELLGALRDVVDEFKDVDKYHRKADEKLIGVEEVKELTAEFVAAYPHWETVVERVGGRPSAGSRPAPDPAAVGPRENYSSPLRGGGQAVGRVSGIATWAEPPLSADPIEEPPWQDVLTSSLLLFRRYESGAAEKEDWLAWDERVRRLRSAYEHYAAGVADLPTYVWTTLFRDALFVPRSAPHRAVTELLELGLSAGSPGSEAEIRRIADRFGVDEAVLHQALGRLTSTV